jgi:hypothetical protein
MARMFPRDVQLGLGLVAVSAGSVGWKYLPELPPPTPPSAKPPIAAKADRSADSLTVKPAPAAKSSAAPGAGSFVRAAPSGLTPIAPDSLAGRKPSGKADELAERLGVALPTEETRGTRGNDDGTEFLPYEEPAARKAAPKTGGTAELPVPENVSGTRGGATGSLAAGKSGGPSGPSLNPALATEKLKEPTTPKPVPKLDLDGLLDDPPAKLPDLKTSGSTPSKEAKSVASSSPKPVIRTPDSVGPTAAERKAPALVPAGARDAEPARPVTAGTAPGERGATAPSGSAVAVKSWDLGGPRPGGATGAGSAADTALGKPAPAHPWFKRYLEEGEYFVRPGDTFENLAERLYGDRGRASELRRLNPIPSGNQPTPGTRLKLR